MSEPLDLLAMADELLAMTNLSLRFTKDPYQIERYQRILEIAAELAAISAHAPVEEIKPLFLHDRGYMTPYSVVETVVFDEVVRAVALKTSFRVG